MGKAPPSPLWKAESAASPRSRSASPEASPRWERPAFEVIALDCEITAYAPAGDEPLF